MLDVLSRNWRSDYQAKSIVDKIIRPFYAFMLGSIGMKFYFVNVAVVVMSLNDS